MGAINDNLGTYETLINQRVSEIAELLHSYGVTLPEGGLRTMLSGKSLGSFVGVVMGGLGSFAADLLLFLLALAFMLIEIIPFDERARAIESPGGGLQTVRIWSEDVRYYIGLKTLTSLATSLLIMAWLVILGVPFVPVWGLLTFLLYFIPNIGAASAAAIVALVEGGLVHGFLTGAGFGVVTTAMNNIVEPRFFGQRLGINMTAILISLVVWDWQLGATGVLLAIPLTLLVKRFLEASPGTEWCARLMG